MAAVLQAFYKSNSLFVNFIVLFSTLVDRSGVLILDATLVFTFLIELPTLELLVVDLCCDQKLSIIIIKEIKF